MVSRTIKISEENYRRLLRIAADLQKQSEEKVSFDDALNIMEPKKDGRKLSDLAGGWSDMSDKELAEIKDEIKKGRKKWKIQSV